MNTLEINGGITALKEAVFIYNNASSVRDAKKMMKRHYLLDTPIDFRLSIWSELTNLCETNGYFKVVI